MCCISLETSIQGRLLTKVTECKCSLGETPLHLAIQSNLKEMCQLLLMNGADRHILTKKGQSPLELASKINQELLVFIRGKIKWIKSTLIHFELFS